MRPSYLQLIIYYDTSAVKFYFDECEVYRPSEARVIIVFVMIKYLYTSAVCNVIARHDELEHECVSTSAINAHLSHGLL